MRNDTRKLFNRFIEQIASLNGAEDATQKFAVEPSVQQKLIDKKQDTSAFLQSINIVQVPEMKGETLGLSVGNPIASRTDTSGTGTRQTKDPSGLDSFGYECFQTNYDTHLRYGKIDMWAKFPDFQTRIQNAIVRAQALDNIRIGFNGTSAAATTNATNNPNLQDVNIGWLQKMRTQKPAQVMTAGTKVAGKVTYGPGGDYATLDALVYDCVNELLPVWAAEDTELVAIVSRDLLHDKYFPLMNESIDPTEQIARDVIMSSKRLGNLPAQRVPYFPLGKVFITRLDNLSIYEQEGKRRRHIKDVPERDRIEDYQSSNDAYVIEDHDFSCLIENIEFKA
ncbi:phage major capsid protein, P2 family [Sphingobium sp. SCG-1]|uniref:phage major capsid protein, P2 family n=1 Tax=Sphingobium sp. SCG-1 TaxID=2072936 RepID=UPI000CD6A74A|nr:phage major capsid protein, P2 family [Sphingobium sp. SCG-1]AUW59450.1 phage major capsid protein, P2 family [Sphingobium sp. SCG-1]